MAIDVHDSWKRNEKDGGGRVYEFWLDTEADVTDLPGYGEWAATTSTAFIKSTGVVKALGVNGWEDI